MPRGEWPKLPDDWPIEPERPILPEGRSIPIVDPSDVCVITAGNRPIEPYERPARYTIGSDWPAQDMPVHVATNYYNYWWSLRHGYRFIRFNSSAPTGWSPLWSKLPAIIQSVRDCEYTLFLDGDAFITEPDVSFQAMLGRWGFHDRASILLGLVPGAEDVWKVNNFGFGIVRRTQTALDALERTLNCPIDSPNCAKHKLEVYHDQSAFTDFIRSSLQLGEDLIDAPCFDANGAWCMGMPEHRKEPAGTRDLRACRGAVVTHGHMCKDQVVKKVSAIVLAEKLSWLSASYKQWATTRHVHGDDYLRRVCRTLRDR